MKKFLNIIYYYTSRFYEKTPIVAGGNPSKLFDGIPGITTGLLVSFISFYFYEVYEVGLGLGGVIAFIIFYLGEKYREKHISPDIFKNPPFIISPAVSKLITICYYGFWFSLLLGVPILCRDLMDYREKRKDMFSDELLWDLLIVSIILLGLLITIIVCLANLLAMEYKNSTRKKDQAKEKVLPAKPVKNDKLVLVLNVEGEKIEKIIQEFCNLANEYDSEFLTRLFSVDTEHWITLPYDESFDGLCYFVNYLYHSFGIKGSTPQLLAWCTPKEGETWVTEEIANKKVMLFIPDWDEEHDNVYLTTEDHIGYKMGFGSGHESMRLEKPVNPFVDLTDHFGKKAIIKEVDFK